VSGGAAPPDARLEPGSFLALLDGPERDAFEAAARRREFPRGAMLMYAEEPGDRVMVVLDGRVKITRTSGDGHQTVLNICGPGEILGELSFIDEQVRVADVIALETVTALILSSTEFRRYLEVTPRVALVVLTILAHRFRDTAIKRTELGTLDTLGRLSARLAELAGRYGEPTDGGTLITVPISQEELGDLVGASPASIAKALQTARELGWITTARRRIVVRDLAALHARAE
jgi:CRP-like cAMP-binding protein